MDTKKTCSICFLTYEGFGNNAQPVNNGFCCNECNATVVLRARWHQTLDGGLEKQLKRPAKT